MTAFPDLSDQHALVESFTRPLEDLAPVSRLAHGDHVTARWREMADLGWFGISLAEEAGGIGLSAIEEALAAQAFGRHLMPPDFAATIIAIHALAAAGAGDAARAGIAGEARAAFAIQDGRTAIDPAGADWLVVLDDDAVEVHAAAASEEVVDEGHWGRPLVAAAPGPCLARAEGLPVLGLARVILSAQLAGIASEAATRAVDYAKVREQFGQPIGAFQAVKHHCANMAITAYAARELSTYAAIALAEGRDEATLLSDAALNVAGRAALRNAGTNIQVHGGMGFSAECDAHHFLKMARLLVAASGGPSAPRRRLVG